jgi:[protein-PII] uridylyltransferase
VFHVSAPPGEALATGTRWEQWQADLLAVFHGEVTFEAAVGSRLREHAGLWRPRPKVATRIEFDNQASRRCTVIDVKAADRLGLLYDVTRTLADRNLTIRLAKIVTNIDQVADSFYVEVVGGGKLTDPGELGRLQRDLEEVISGTRTPEEGG